LRQIAKFDAHDATNINDGILSPPSISRNRHRPGRRVIILISDDVGTGS
jgi:hypothetical protein